VAPFDLISDYPRIALSATGGLDAEAAEELLVRIWESEDPYHDLQVWLHERLVARDVNDPVGAELSRVVGLLALARHAPGTRL